LIKEDNHLKVKNIYEAVVTRDMVPNKKATEEYIKALMLYLKNSKSKILPETIFQKILNWPIGTLGNSKKSFSRIYPSF